MKLAEIRGGGRRNRFFMGFEVFGVLADWGEIVGNTEFGVVGVKGSICLVSKGGNLENFGDNASDGDKMDNHLGLPVKFLLFDDMIDLEGTAGK